MKNRKEFPSTGGRPPPDAYANKKAKSQRRTKRTLSQYPKTGVPAMVFIIP